MSDLHERLLWQCSEVLATFDPGQTSVEEHVNNYISTLPPGAQGEDGDGSEADHTFVKEVFAGCVQYSVAIAVVLEGFYNTEGKNTLRSHQPVYHVICYLALFRLEELGLKRFRKFVNCLEVNNAYKFLSVFLSEKNLVTWIKHGWLTLYDSTFVHDKLLEPILGRLDELQEITKYLKLKIDNQLDLPSKKNAQATTEPRPFNLTQPKPRSVPMPEPIPKLKKHNPVPRSLYSAPAERTVIAKVREDNRRQAEERLMDASRRQFACANPEKTYKTMEGIQNVLQEQDSKLDFDRHRARPLPSSLNRDIPIKMNTATILREGSRYQKIAEREMQKLADLEAGRLHMGPFEEWQSAMMRKDNEARMTEFERRKLLGKMSYEEAIMAKKNLTQENKSKVARFKKEAEALMQKHLEQKLIDDQNVKLIVNRTAEHHQNVRDTRKRMQETKRQLVLQMNAENKELMRVALEEAEADMQRRLQLIRQIKAMEVAPLPRKKTIDFTATSGARLLIEMSIAELRERLDLMRAEQKDAEERKRDEILEAKQAKDQQLINTLECISKHRLEQTRSAAIRLEERRRPKPKVLPPELTDLQRQFEEKKQARLRAQQEEKEMNMADNASRQALLRKQGRALEESRWKELERTRERSAKLLYGDNPPSDAPHKQSPFLAATMATLS